VPYEGFHKFTLDSKRIVCESKEWREKGKSNERQEREGRRGENEKYVRKKHYFGKRRKDVWKQNEQLTCIANLYKNIRVKDLLSFGE